jgi:hypothetical protein
MFSGVLLSGPLCGPFVCPFVGPFVCPFGDPFVCPFVCPFGDPFGVPFGDPFDVPLCVPFDVPWYEYVSLCECVYVNLPLYKLSRKNFSKTLDIIIFSKLFNQSKHYLLNPTTFYCLFQYDK